MSAGQSTDPARRADGARAAGEQAADATADDTAGPMPPEAHLGVQPLVVADEEDDGAAVTHPAGRTAAPSARRDRKERKPPEESGE